MDQYDPDPAATTALLASGAVQAGASAVTVRNRDGDLRFFCRDRLLVTDFSRIAADPAAQGKINGNNQSFDLSQTPFMRSLTIRYPLVRTDSSANLIRASGVSIYLVSNGGFKGTKKSLEGISFDGVASGPTEAIFLLDDNKRQLLPLKFAGNDAGARTTVGRPVGPTLVLYYAPDFGSPTGWLKTTVDFAGSLIWTQPVPRPTLPIAK